MSDASRISAETVERLTQAGTGVVSDALALLGFQGGVEGIHPARGFEAVRLAGPACTIQFGLPRPDTPKLTTYGIIEYLPPGSVLVIDAKGDPRHFAGDNVGTYAKQHGLLGVIVAGGARDVAGWRRAEMPLYCMGLATKDKPAGLRITGCQVPVEIGGVLVKPEDILVADEDGIVVIPRESLEAVLEKVTLVLEVEAAMQDAIARKASGAELAAIIARKKPT
jgi:regulator of RNase E activity RraA